MPNKRCKFDPNSGEELDQILYEYFMPNFRKGYLKVGETECCIPVSYEKIAERIDNFEVRDDDVFVISHPKTGTTWTQEMVWCIGNNLDLKKAETFLFERFPFLDVDALFDFDFDLSHKEPPKCIIDPIAFANNMESPRYIKTHFPWELLPNQIKSGEKKPKIIYVSRNPKDTCVSYYHHCRKAEGFTGNFEQFTKLFLGNRVCFAPFWPHTLKFWEMRNEDNILFIKYEDMKRDLPSVLHRVAKFLNKQLTESDVAVLCDHLSFEKMKHNMSVNHEVFETEEYKELAKEIKWERNTDTKFEKFMRKGIVGSYKAEMTPEMIKQFDKWTEQHLKGTGLTYE